MKKSRPGAGLYATATLSFVAEIAILAALIYYNMDLLEPLNKRAEGAQIVAALLVFVFGVLIISRQRNFYLSVDSIADSLKTIADRTERN